MWRKRLIVKVDAPLSAADERLMTMIRDELAQRLAPLLDESRDAARHARADEITDGRFSKEMEKYR